MSVEEVLDAVRVVQGLIEDEKEHLQNGLYLRLCDAMQKVYNRAHALKKAENDNSDESDEDEGGDAEEVRMVSTPGGPYYMCSDGSYVRVWNNPHMLAQLAAGGARNWRERRGAREGAHRGRHGGQRAGGAVGVEL
jgi:hypothetical protein